MDTGWNNNISICIWLDLFFPKCAIPNNTCIKITCVDFLSIFINLTYQFINFINLIKRNNFRSGKVLDFKFFFLTSLGKNRKKFLRYFWFLKWKLQGVWKVDRDMEAKGERLGKVSSKPLPWWTGNFSNLGRKGGSVGTSFEGNSLGNKGFRLDKVGVLGNFWRKFIFEKNALKNTL